MDLSELQEVVAQTLLNNTFGAWGAALAVGVLVFIVLALVKRFLRRRMERTAAIEAEAAEAEAAKAEAAKADATGPAGETPEAPSSARTARWPRAIGGAVARTTTVFILILAVYAGSRVLVLSAGMTAAIDAALVIAVFLQGAMWASRLVTMLLEQRAAGKTAQDDSFTNALALITLFARICVWSVALLLILDNLDFDITTLVAGFGIGGIAIALAAQNILGDLFASLSIVLDKPFVKGDFIVFGDFLGNVERIGLKTTRIRSLSGEQIVCANADLLSSRIRNYQRMMERRAVFTLGVVYQTPAEKLEKIPTIIREAVEAQENARFDRAHFKAYGDFSLNFEVVFWILLPDYNVYMDVQQAVNLAIYRRFQEEGIEFAYPTRTLFIAKDDGSEGESSPAPA